MKLIIFLLFVIITPLTTFAESQRSLEYKAYKNPNHIQHPPVVVTSVTFPLAA